MQNSPAVPEGWSIQSVTFHRDLAYWGLWALYMLSSMMPGVNPESPAADVSYVLRRDADGTLKTIRLSGDHAPDELVKTMQLMEAGAGPRQG